MAVSSDGRGEIPLRTFPDLKWQGWRARPTVHGFTLLELLVVLAILSIVATVILPALFKSSVTELKASARAVAAGLRETRSFAITRHQATAFTLDVSEKTFATGGVRRSHTLPEEIGVSLYTARSELRDEKRGAIRFFPDGSSTGGRVTLAADDQSYVVDVGWLTGRIRILEGNGPTEGDNDGR